MQDFIKKTKGMTEASLYIGSVDNQAFLDYVLVTDIDSLITALKTDNILVHITKDNTANKALYDCIFNFATGQIVYKDQVVTPKSTQQLSIVVAMDFDTLKQEEQAGRVWRSITALTYQD